MTMRSIFGWLGVAALAVSLGCVPTGGGGGGGGDNDGGVVPVGGSGGGAGGTGGGAGGGTCTPACVEGQMCGPDGCGGVCGTCEEGLRCIEGMCSDEACPAGTLDCGGVCTELLTDADNCGSCGSACPRVDGLVAECIAAECFNTCPALSGQGANVDLTNDPGNCGACGTECPAVGGAAVCEAGACVDPCVEQGLTGCGEECIDTTADPENCGGCDNICPTAENGFPSCVGGECQDPCEGNTNCNDLLDAALDQAVADQSVDQAVPDMTVDMLAPDMAQPEACARWADQVDQPLLDALYTELHDTYRPVEVMVDLGGNPNRYTTARALMFTEVEFMDRDGQGGHECAYTGAFVAGEMGVEPNNDDLNCEHTWPRARMGARDTLLYSHQQSDIHHLLPTVPGVNSSRGSLHFGESVRNRDLSWSPAIRGVDGENHGVFAPRAERKGDVARVIFYFSARWGADIVDWEEATLRRWHAEDPVDARERGRNDAIEGIQGNRNPFIDCPGLVGSIADFRSFPILDNEQTLAAP